MLDRFLTISERKKESGLAFIWNTHCHGGPSLPASSLTSLQTLDNGTLVFTIDYFHSSLFTYGIQSKPPKPWLGIHHFSPPPATSIEKYLFTLSLLSSCTGLYRFSLWPHSLGLTQINFVEKSEYPAFPLKEVAGKKKKRQAER